MYVFRMRSYAVKPDSQSNCAENKIEAVSELCAQRCAEHDSRYIYFFVDLVCPD